MSNQQQQSEKDKNVKPMEAAGATKSAPGSSSQDSGTSKTAQGSTPRSDDKDKKGVNSPEEVKTPFEGQKKAV